MKKRSDEEIAEEYYKARLKDPNAKPPSDYSPADISSQVLEAVKRTMMRGCTHGDRVSKGKWLAKQRRLQEQRAKNEESQS